MFRTLTAAAAVTALSASLTMAEDAVFTLSVQELPEGTAGQVAAARAGFLNVIAQQDGLESDQNFLSFFTFPEPPKQSVIVGFTEWDDLDALRAAQKSAMSAPATGAYMQSVDMKALISLVTADGSEFDLSDYVTDPDTVIEFAIRRPREGMDDAFIESRDQFFARVAEQPGNLFAQEFVMPEGASEMVSEGTDWTAVVIGWDSIGAFQTALGTLSQMPEMGAFQGTVDALAYHATVPQQ